MNGILLLAALSVAEKPIYNEPVVLTAGAIANSHYRSGWTY